VAGRVGDDELAFRGGEVAVGDVDGDTLLALRPQAVGQQREIDRSGRAVDLALLDRGDLIFKDASRVVEKAADERGLAVID
jgi:hypothetical protein